MFNFKATKESKAQSELKEVQHKIRALLEEAKFKEVNDFNNKYSDLCNQKYTLERELSRIKKEEYLVNETSGLSWSSGAPIPFVISNENKTFLTFFLENKDPEWDGTYVSIRSANDNFEQIGVIEFEFCNTYRFGAPND